MAGDLPEPWEGGLVSGIQFRIFTVGDETLDPTTGAASTETERIRATVAIAKKVEEAGLDVFATGEHRNPRPRRGPV